MALDNERNQVLTALRERPDGMNVAVLGEHLGLAREAVERHLLYCADYGLATWKRVRSGLGLTVITERGRDYLTRQNL